MIEVLKTILFGIVEGITEWLPVSSTGHMILINEMIELNGSKEYINMYMVVIQLGAILAVIISFWPKIWPLKKEQKNIRVKKETINLWLKVMVATIPVMVIGLAFDDYIEKNLQTPLIIAITLIIYGALFIIVECKTKKIKINSTNEISFKIAFFIGIVQTLSLIPGTSRSGVTIIFALAIGISRVAASEFTFLLAIPTMLGASILKLFKFGFTYTNQEICLLLIGILVSFITSIIVIKFLMAYIKKKDFKIFGVYRIFLGILIALLLI